MGSGLLYGGIGVLWIVVLGRTWLNRRITSRADRGAPASSRQRILDTSGRSRRGRRGPGSDGRRSDGRRSDGRRVVSVQQLPGRDRPVSRSARRRRRVLLLLVVLAGALAAGFAAHRVPVWAPVAGLAVALCWFTIGLFAARAGRRARRGHRRRLARRERITRERAAARAVAAETVLEPLDEPAWSSVPSVGIVARWGREENDTDGLDPRPVTAAGLSDTSGFSVAPWIPMQPAVAVEVAPGSWQPVPVPVPTYVTAPLAPRTVASITLGAAGSWTSASGPTSEQTAQILLGAPGRDSRSQHEVDTRSASSSQARGPGRHAATVASVDSPAGPAAVADAPDEDTAEVDFELPEAVGH